MSEARRTRATWIGSVCLLAVLALVAVRLPGAAEPEPGAAGAPQCAAGGEGSVDTQADELIARTMQDLRERKADGDGWVVLNNRGYNYGPAPGPQFDALLGDVANPSEDAR